MSDIADSVQYVPLETNDKCLIDFINSGKVVKTGKYWFVSSNTRLYQYTTDGKFVRNIGSRGGGPGQFNYFQQIDVNEYTGLIFMLTTSGKINVYEMETGKFLYDIKIPDKETDEKMKIPPRAELQSEQTVRVAGISGYDGKNITK